MDAYVSDFQPPECETMRFCRLSHSACRTLLWQPQDTDFHPRPLSPWASCLGGSKPKFEGPKGTYTYFLY